ncbi:radical SAM additional 4Fe4S-binding domain protein [Methanosarcina thermophila]|jgi:uncharacterized protein|uniref:Radical SAM additional 4Fe4S-binding domain protein n=1 Tax=Methanosarcina thermophila TaxID=2210 RepID=A0A3G9CX40_METTE|nr:radical SAM additional 4Fe4S-binding domain protein [Methanosarcina thermophila]
MKPSFYNLSVTVDGRDILYNGLTGAMLEIDRGSFDQIADALKDIPLERAKECKSAQAFIDNMFLVADELNELDYIKTIYNLSRFNDSPTLTIAPTLNCNLNCRYCYEEKSPKRMNEKTIEALKVFFRKTLDETETKSISVDWYGGEPLLEYNSIIELSKSFQKDCNERGCKYRSSMTTNGTLLTKDVLSSLTTHGVSMIQVTLDGTKDAHDRNRPFSNSNKSSFEAIIKNLEDAVGEVVLAIRMNADKDNMAQILDQLKDFQSRGWLTGNSKFFPYIAPIRNISKNCNLLPSKCLTVDYFDVFTLFISRLKELGLKLQRSEIHGYPMPVNSNCGAVSLNSYVVNPDGLLFKCGLTIDNPAEKVGSIFEPICLSNPALTKWLSYDPFQREECLDCIALPTCLSGCPKANISNDNSATHDHCSFLKNNLTRLISLHGND